VAEVIFDELKRQGLDENTLVIFTSDNGSRMQDQGGSNGVLRGRKGETWEGGQRVPCMMRWPGRIPAGEVRNELMTAIDFFPTIAGLAGAEVPKDRTTDGKDMSALMFAAEPTESPRSEFFYYDGNNLEAVRDDRWKLHIHKVDEVINELYDLDSDPGETVNVFDDHPDVVARLTSLIEACAQDLGDQVNGITGNDVRLSGRVENPETLTHYDPEHPYIYAEYDKAERG
jgi:arylsulfatase A-like enzyme